MVGGAVSHCEPADCRCHHSVNSVARPDGNRVIDWSFLISSTKYTDDCIKLISVTSFSAGKGTDEIENNVSLMI